MIGLLINYQKNKFLRYFKARRTAKLITVGLFMVVFSGIATGIYFFFREGFSYIQADDFFKEAFILYVYEMYLLLFMYLVIFSTLITGLFSLFKGSNDDWVMSSPGFRATGQYVFLKTCFNAIWPFLIIVFPTLFAIRHVIGLSVTGFLAITLSAILFTIIIVSIVFIMIVLVGLLGKAGRVITFMRLAFFMILLLVISIWLVFSTAVSTDLIKMFSAEDLGTSAAGVELVRDNFRFLPTHMLASSILYWQSGDTSSGILNLVTILGLALVLILAWWFLSARILPIWQVMQEGEKRLARTKKQGKSRKKGFKYQFRGGQIMAIFKKEALVGSRNIRDLLWAGFLLLVWLSQSGLNSVLGKNIARYNLEANAGPALIQALQFATAVFFVSAFVLRFVFPAFSSERKTAWILNSAPINFQKIMYAKLSFYFVFIAGVGVAISYFNLSLLEFAFTDIGVILTLFITAVLFLTVFGLALGAIFPNMETDDPAVLSTSLPGLGFVAGSLLYGALGAYVLYNYIVGGAFGFVLGHALISILFIIYLLYQAPRSLAQTDFVKTY